MYAVYGIAFVSLVGLALTVTRSDPPPRWPLAEMTTFEKRVMAATPHGNTTCVCTLVSSIAYSDLYLLPWLRSVQKQWDGDVYVLAAHTVDTPADVHRVSFDADDTLPWASESYKHQHHKSKVWDLPCDRVLYMDLDTRAMQPLHHVFDACHSAFCAVPDAQGLHKTGFPIFNGGVWVATPDKLTFLAAERYFKAAPETRFVEQTWLNEALGFRAVQLLSPIYNAQRGCEDVPPRLLHTVIICHCTFGKEKEACMSSLYNE